MLPGPVFLIEVQTSGRRSRFILVRALYASLLLVALCIAYTIYADSWHAAGPPTIEATASLANTFYQICVWGQLFAIVAFAPAIVAGTIAQDRERRILDALLSSDLRDAEIVLSKYAARTLHVFYLVLAGLPVLQIASLMGGISPQRLWMSFAIILSTVLFVAAVSLLISVLARRARDAVLGTYVVLFLWLIVPLLLVFLMTFGLLPGLGRLYVPMLQPLFGLLALPNPFLSLMRVTADPATRLTAVDPWAEVGALVAAQMAIAATCLLASVWLLRRVHARIAARPARKRDPFRLLRPAVGQRAMIWKEFFAEQSGGLMRVLSWLVLGGAMGGFLVFIGWVFLDSFANSTAFGGYGNGFVTESSAVGSFLISSLVALMFVTSGVLLLIAARAATSVTGERERDTWTTLIGTTLGGPEIVLAKIAGNVFAFRYLLAGLGFAWMLMLSRAPLMAIPMAYWLLILTETCWFASALGVFFSLHSKSTARAMGATVGTLFLVGGGYFFCCLPAVIKAGPGSDGLLISMAPMIPFLLVFPPICAVVGAPSDSEASVLFSAVMLGTTGYGIAGIAITSYCMAAFNRLAGRSHHGEYERNRRRPRREAFILAELVSVPAAPAELA